MRSKIYLVMALCLISVASFAKQTGYCIWYTVKPSINLYTKEGGPDLRVQGFGSSYHKPIKIKGEPNTTNHHGLPAEAFPLNIWVNVKDILICEDKKINKISKKIPNPAQAYNVSFDYNNCTLKIKAATGKDKYKTCGK